MLCRGVYEVNGCPRSQADALGLGGSGEAAWTGGQKAREAVSGRFLLLVF